MDWGSQRTADRLHKSNGEAREVRETRTDRAMEVDALWVRRRNVRKRKKEDVGIQR